jgi:uncharacterized protein (TIGR03067 family)
MKTVSVVVLTIVLAGAADIANELKKLEGTWLPIAAEEDGKAVAGEGDITKLEITIKGDKVQRKNRDRVDDFATIKIDPAKKHLDLIVKGEKAATLKGLYKLDGDTLKLCFPSLPNKDRPAQFGGQGTQVLTFNRQKP